MYVANTHLKPVIGIDLHFVNLPFPFVPLPHPYIGLVIDPFDYIPMIGATVKVNNVPRGNTDTGGMIITFVHIPFGAGFTLMPMIGHDSQNFFGSKTVQVDGAPMSGAGYMLMTCNDIGIPLSFSPGKKFIPIPSLYLPTSFVIPLQWGAPVQVGGPLVPNFSLMALLKAFALGSFFKIFGKLGSKALKALNNKVLKKFPATQKLGDKLCKMGFEPVDLITGRVNYEYTDFELPGPIPIIWKRTWDSDSQIQGVMGHGVQFWYDRAVHCWPEENALAVILEDGRPAAFPMLHPGEEFYHPQEKILLRRKQNGHFLLEDYNQELYFHFNYTAQPNIYKLSFIENYSGYRVQLHYNSQYLSAITDSVGRQLLLDVDAEHRITQVTIRHRNLQKVMVRYQYDEDGNLSGITDALDQTTSLEYQDHLLVMKTDRNGYRFYWGYDNQRRCIHTWGDGGVMEGFIQYHKGYNVTSNAVGDTITYFYDENNLCVQEMDHYGNSRYTEYTENSQLFRTIDEEGNITGYKYDDRGNMVEMMLPDGNTMQFHYNDHNQLTLMVDSDGTVETHGYDAQHRTEFINYPNEETWTYEYNEEGQLTTIIEKGGKVTQLGYDEDENVTSMQLPNGGTIYWKFNALGYIIQTTNTEGLSRSFEYDQLERVKKLYLPDGNQLKLEYDAYENITRAVDNHNDVIFEYTPLGQLKTRKQDGQEIEFIYDKHEQLKAIVNEKGSHYSIGYNHRGEVISETGFDGAQRKYERSPSGLILKTLRPGNRFTKYEYDASGNPVRLEFQDGSWSVFDYDKNGRLREAVNEHSTVRFTYGKTGEVNTEDQNGYTVSNTYDSSGNRTGLTSSLGADIRFTRNEMGLVTNMQARVEKLLWQAQMKYNKAGYEIERTLPGGLKSEWQYDQAARPSEHKVSRDGVTVSLKKYTWDADDRLRNIFNALALNNTRFRYDLLGNLAFAQYADNSIVNRSFDATGNVYENTDKSDRRYDSAGALLESKKYTYQYDEEGNLLSKRSKTDGKQWRYEWYGNNMLRKVTRPDGKTVEFTYDALGRRITKRYNGTITRWVWDGDVPLHEWTYDEKLQPKAVVTEWAEITFDREEPNPGNQEAVNPITWLFDEGEDFGVCGKIEGTNTYSILIDHNGVPKEAYDEKGKRAWEAELDIYGRVRAITGKKAFIPFRYKGQYEDEETGLYYNRHRYYSPEEGAYISQDPIRTDGGMQLYSYVADPNSSYDPMGLAPVFSPKLAKVARRAKSTLYKPGAPRQVAINQSTVSVAEGILPNGERQLFASGNNAYLRPKVIKRLVASGVPRENIYSGAAFREKVFQADGKTIDRKATNLVNHAERVVIRNAPAGTRFPVWGIDWGGTHQNASCANCTPHVNCHS